MMQYARYSGLTAYNHNLDTSREFYPEVCCIDFD